MAKQKDEAQLLLEKEVKRLRRNLMRTVSRAKKRGYTFSSDFVPNLPKNITEGTLRKFQKYTPKYIYGHSVYVSPEGTKQKGLERRKEEASEVAKRAAETRKRHYAEQEVPKESQPKIASNGSAPESKKLLMTIEDLIWQIEFGWYDRSRLWTHQENGKSLEEYKQSDASYMRAALDEAIATQGEEAVLERINANAKTIYEIIEQVLLGSGDQYHMDARDGVINAQVQKFAEILKGAPLTVSESLYLTDIAEKQQNFIVPQ